MLTEVSKSCKIFLEVSLLLLSLGVVQTETYCTYIICFGPATDVNCGTVNKTFMMNRNWYIFYAKVEVKSTQEGDKLFSHSVNFSLLPHTNSAHKLYLFHKNLTDNFNWSMFSIYCKNISRVHLQSLWSKL